MSAWYVLAAMGLNPMCPGDGRWFLTPPIFEETTIRLDPRFYPGGTFTIRTRGVVSGGRIAAVRLNGRKIAMPWITTRDIASGGVLELELKP